MQSALKSLIGKNVHIHTIRSNESIFGELREVGDQVAVVVYGEHTYYIALSKIVWFQEWPSDGPESAGPFRGDIH